MEEVGKLSEEPTAWGQPVSPERRVELEKLPVLLSDWEANSNAVNRLSAVDGQALAGADVFWLSAIALGAISSNNVLFMDLDNPTEDMARWLRYVALHKYAEISHRLPVLNLEGVYLASEHMEHAYLERALLSNAVLHDAHLEYAHLSNAELRSADLVQARMDHADLIQSSLEYAEINRACLRHASLIGAHLENARLQSTVLYQANLHETHLEGCDLTGALLAGADLREAFFDASTKLEKVSLVDDEHGAVIVADVHWGDVNLAVIDWVPFIELKIKWRWPVPTREGKLIGDEDFARRKNKHALTYDTAQKKVQEQQQVQAFQQAARANRQLATVLRGQGMNEEADYFAYRAQASQRAVLYHRRTVESRSQWLFSWFLCLLAGYGYKPLRTLFIYLIVIMTFSFFYIAASSSIGFGEAVILSVSAFHGRGFFQPVGILGDPISALAAIEAVIGLIVEASFIATFIQRFFSR